MDSSLNELQDEQVMNREAWHAAIHGVARSRACLRDWTEVNWTLFSMVKDWKLFFWDREEGKDVHTASLFNKGLKPLTRAITQEKEIKAFQSEKLESYRLP